MFSYFRTADELMSQQEPDPLPQWTNEPCPFCGQRIQWDGDQLFCAPCQRTWADWSDVRFDRHEVKYAARKAAQVAAQEAAMWEYYEDDQRDEDSSSYADAVARLSRDGCYFDKPDGTTFRLERVDAEQVQS